MEAREAPWRLRGGLHGALHGGPWRLHGGLYGGPWRSPWRSVEVSMEFREAPSRSVEVSMEARGGFMGVSMEVRGGLHGAPWRSAEVSMEVRGGLRRSPWRSVDVSIEVRGGFHGGPSARKMHTSLLNQCKPSVCYKIDRLHVGLNIYLYDQRKAPYSIILHIQMRCR